MHPAASSPASTYSNETANDRFKRGAAWRSSRSIVAAVAVHFVLFALWPQMTTATLTSESQELMVITPPDVDIPPSPEQIARPALPVIGSVTIDEHITIESSEKLWQRELEIAPPPVSMPRRDDGYSVFVRDMVAPRLLNPEEVQRALQTNYPMMLRNAGIGGKVEMHLWVDERGTITKAEVAASSGQPMLDEAALRVVRTMRMSPAENRGSAVRVIVSLPVSFSVR